MSFAIHVKPRSIRTQLTLWYLLMLGSALAAFATAVFLIRVATLSREVDAELNIRAQHLVAVLQPRLLELDPVQSLADDRRLFDEAFVVRERSGAPVYRSPAFPSLRGENDAAAVRAARVGDGLSSVDDPAGGTFRLATLLVERTGAAPLVVQVAAPTEPDRAMLRQLAVTMVVLFLLVLSAASYGGSFIARRALQPVDAIVARVRAIQASRLEERLDVRTGSEELDRLVDTLNGMLDRLETSMHGARRFAADASHELQTPIAALRAALDVGLGDELSAPEYRALAGELVADIDRLSALVRDLRLLALADAGHLFERAEPVDLGLVVRECCEIVRAVAEPKQIAVSIDVLADVTVSGSAPHLRRALLNLAHNAVRYSAAGSTIQVTVGRLESEAVVAVVDEGCGISPQDLPHVFERFYRADPARARDTGGTGLGLAIADHIVRTHGGRIEVSSILDQGSTFAVFLPLSAVSDASPAHPPQTINAF